jgi:hypothetical protein
MQNPFRGEHKPKAFDLRRTGEKIRSAIFSMKIAEQYVNDYCPDVSIQYDCLIKHLENLRDAIDSMHNMPMSSEGEREKAAETFDEAGGAINKSKKLVEQINKAADDEIKRSRSWREERQRSSWDRPYTNMPGLRKPGLAPAFSRTSSKKGVGPFTAGVFTGLALGAGVFLVGGSLDND